MRFPRIRFGSADQNSDSAGTTYVFIHIPKTGGVSVLQTLDRQVDKAGNLRCDSAPAAVPSELVETVRDREQRGLDTIVHGHLPYGIHHNLGAERARYFTLLRDPIDRVVSAFYFLSAVPPESLSEVERVLITMGLEAAVASGTSHNFDNQMVRQLCGTSTHTPIGTCTAADAELALHNLATGIEVVGDLARIEGFYAQLRAQFGWDVPNDGGPRAHVTPSRPGLEDLEPRTLAVISEFNRFDIWLYEQAQIHVKGLQTT